MLQLMAEEFERASIEYANVEPTITRIFGIIEGDSKVHYFGRAIDFRDEHGGLFLYTKEEREKILAHINNKFPRLDKLFSLIWHRFKEGAYHFHLQLSWDAHVYAGMFVVAPPADDH